MNHKIKFIIAVMSFGTIGVFVRNIALNPAEIALFRALIALIILSGYVFITKNIKNLIVDKKNLLKLFISGAAIGFNWILLFEAFNHTSVALATLSYYFAPIIVVVLSALLFKEKLSFKQVLCFLAATVGIVMIVYTGSLEDGNIIGILFGLSAALLYASVILINKRISGVDLVARTIFQFLAAVVILVPYVAFTSGFGILGLNFIGVANLSILGAYHTGIVYCLYFFGVSRLRGQQVAVLSYLDPVVAVILSITILGESILPIHLVGGGIILLATFFNEFKRKQVIR
ncbi:MAG: DMT family transporter [Defluviitaleaceae bacterium]|nr:DMT family transporter [Defluviitaleaceae bacterium]